MKCARVCVSFSHVVKDLSENQKKDGEEEEKEGERLNWPKKKRKKKRKIRN